MGVWKQLQTSPSLLQQQWGGHKVFWNEFVDRKMHFFKVQNLEFFQILILRRTLIWLIFMAATFESYNDFQVL